MAFAFGSEFLGRFLDGGRLVVEITRFPPSNIPSPSRKKYVEKLLCVRARTVSFLSLICNDT